MHLYNLLKIDHDLLFPSLEVRSFEVFDVRIKALITLGHDFHNDTHLDELEEVTDPSSPLAVIPSVEFRAVNDTP